MSIVFIPYILYVIFGIFQIFIFVPIRLQYVYTYKFIDKEKLKCLKIDLLLQGNFFFLRTDESCVSLGTVTHNGLSLR